MIVPTMASGWHDLCLASPDTKMFSPQRGMDVDEAYGSRRGLLPWWRHQIETFFALLALCVGNSPVTGEFLAQGTVTRSFDVFSDLRLNKRFSKQSTRR